MSNKSFLGQSTVRGLRNNNPFNLRRTANAWQGKIPFSQSTDNDFEQFYTVAWGLRAGYKDIMGDITNKGQNTVRKLISAFAPAHENNTNSYVNQVASALGVGIDTVLTANSTTIIALAKAIVRVELGATAAAKITNEDYIEAWQLLGSSFDNNELGELTIVATNDKCPLCGHIIIAGVLFFFTYLGLIF